MTDDAPQWLLGISPPSTRQKTRLQNTGESQYGPLRLELKLSELNETETYMRSTIDCLINTHRTGTWARCLNEGTLECVSVVNCTESACVFVSIRHDL